MNAETVVYLCIFAAGFLLLGIMAVVGDGDVDVDADLDIDAEMGSPNAFSLKVISCFLVGFGAMATVSSYWISYEMAIKQRVATDLGLGLIGGMLIGFAGWAIFRFFLSQQASYHVTQDEFVGKRANLRVGIPSEGVGEIFIEHAGRNQTVDVKSESGSSIPSGTLVEVVSVNGNIGYVRPVTTETAQ